MQQLDWVEGVGTAACQLLPRREWLSSSPAQFKTTRNTEFARAFASSALEKRLVAASLDFLTSAGRSLTPSSGKIFISTTSPILSACAGHFILTVSVSSVS